MMPGFLYLTKSVVGVDDIVPDVFTFTDQTNALANTVYTSNTIVVSGISIAVPISVSVGEYRINAGAWTNLAGTVNNGDQVTVRGTSSGTPGGVVNVPLTISGVTDTYTITTATVSATGIEEVVGNLPSEATINAAGGTLAAYLEIMKEYGLYWYNTQGTSDVIAGNAAGETGGYYYDRPLVWYSLYQITRDTAWLTRAHAYVETYMTWLETRLYDGSKKGNWVSGFAPWSYPKGVYCYMILNAGDTTKVNRAKANLGYIADRWYVSDYWYNSIAWPSANLVDNRECAYFMACNLWAWKAGVSSPYYSQNYQTRLATALTDILTRPDPTLGYLRDPAAEGVKPFMNSLLRDSIADCYELFTPLTSGQKASLLDAVKKDVDYEFAIRYRLDRDNASGRAACTFYYSSSDPTVFYNDLNALVGGSYCWLYTKGAGERFLHRADNAIMSGVQGGSTVVRGKQFNQTFKISPRWLEYRGGGTPNPTAPNTMGYGGIAATISNANGWTGYATVSSGGLGEDGVTNVNRFLVQNPVNTYFDVSKPPINISLGNIIVRARRPSSGGSAAFRLATSNYNWSTGISQKFTFAGTNVWETHVLTGNLLVVNSSNDFEPGYVDIGKRTETMADDATIPNGNSIDIQYVHAGLNPTLPDHVVSGFAFSGGSYTVAGLGQGVVTRIEALSGTYSINGVSMGSTEGAVCNGDVIAASAGAQIKIGRIPGLHAGTTATA